MVDVEMYPCPNCPREGVIYESETRGQTLIIYIKCPGCRLAWTVEQPTSETAPTDG